MNLIFFLFLSFAVTVRDDQIKTGKGQLVDRSWFVLGAAARSGFVVAERDRGDDQRKLRLLVVQYPL